MRSSRRKAPNINTGSMADIAFLLLIFFLVTATIPNEQGFHRKLPKPCPTYDCSEVLNERNTFRILVNANNELLVDDERITIDALKSQAKAFIDNNGEGTCDYCGGAQSATASDHPSKAVIILQVHRSSDYNTFIAIQDELTKAYYELRAQYAETLWDTAVSDLTPSQLKILREAYPFIVSEAQTK